MKSPASRMFTQPFIQTQIKENIKAPRHWPLCGEFTGDRWIPRTKGQLRGKCFHLMTSSWLFEKGFPVISDTLFLDILQRNGQNPYVFFIELFIQLSPVSD